ncbi:MAG: hypothetical protein QXY61_04035 [Candidatus Anstonellales archaeon]
MEKMVDKNGGSVRKPGKGFAAKEPEVDRVSKVPSREEMAKAVREWCKKNGYDPDETMKRYFNGVREKSEEEKARDEFHEYWVNLLV